MILKRRVLHLIAGAAVVVFQPPSAANAQRADTIPANASPSFDGGGWACKAGFLRRQTTCISVEQATDAEIRKHLIDESIASYPGRCPCPYFSDGAGRSCGRRSAYSRPGGYSPKCYPQDVSAEEVRAFRRELADTT